MPARLMNWIDKRRRAFTIISVIYWFFGSSIVLFAERLFPFEEQSIHMGTVFRLLVEICFVFLTALLLFVLLSQMKRLRESEERYRKIVDHSPDAILIIKDNAICYTNAAGVAMYGAGNEKELLGISPDRFYLHKPEVYESRPRQETIVTLDGRTIDVETTNIPITLEGKRAMLIHRRDITERNIEKMKLWETNHMLQTLISSCPLAIIVLDLDFRVKVWNRAAEEMFGYSEEEVLGRRYPVVPQEEEQHFVEMDRAIFSGKTLKSVEVKRRRKDGKKVTAALSTAPLRDAAGKVTGLIGVLADITEQKKTEELLRKSEKLSAAGQLAAGVAHEIRNPLTSIKGFLQLMRENRGPHERYLDIILPEITRIEEIITEILVLAKPQSRKFRRTNVNRMIHQVISLLNSHAILKNIDIVFVDKIGKQVIYGDENQLKQVMINLLKNGIEAMDDGGTIKIELQKEKEKELAIRVTDEGCGISENQLKRLGEPFYTTKEFGTGLGLMCTYKMVEEHRGTIEFESEPGIGTTVTVRLPISD